MQRYIDIYYDVSRGYLLNAAQSAISTSRKEDWPYVGYKEQPLIRLHLYTYSNGTFSAFTGFAGLSAFSAAIDKDWLSTSSPMVRSVNEDINVPGDWASADPATGLFAIRIDAATTEFLTAIDGKSSRTAYLELKGYDGDGNITAVINPIPILAKGLIDPDEDPPTEVQSNFYTKSQSDARYIGVNFVKGSYTLTASGNLHTILFDTPFATLPKVVASLKAPDGSVDFVGMVVSTVGLGSFDIVLSADLLALAGYKVDYIAFEESSEGES